MQLEGLWNFRKNRALPAHTSTTMLIDDLTGYPFAVVEANYLNGLRTAAADALAVRALSRPDASTLGIIGIGAQAICEALAVAHVRAIMCFSTALTEIPSCRAIS